MGRPWRITFGIGLAVVLGTIFMSLQFKPVKPAADFQPLDSTESIKPTEKSPLLPITSPSNHQPTSPPSPLVTPQNLPAASPSETVQAPPGTLLTVPTTATIQPQSPSLTETAPAPISSPSLVPIETPPSSETIISATPSPSPTISATPALSGLRLSCRETIDQADQDDDERTAQCTATAIFADGSQNDVTNLATWSLDPPAQGTISQTGFYKAGPEPGDTIVIVFETQTLSHDIDL